MRRRPRDPASSFPLELVNCGRVQRFAAPPRRIAGLDQISTELLLHLGAVDDIVLTANQSDPPFPAIAREYALLERLGPVRNYPAAETMVNVAPDFVIGNMELLSFSRAAGFGGPFSRDELAARGVASFALQCQGETDAKAQLFARYVELGRILGRGVEAQQEIAAVQASLDETAQVLAAAAPIRTFLYIDGRGPLQTLGTLLTAAGGQNIIDENEGGCCPPAVPLEVVTGRDPEAILISSFGALRDEVPTVASKQATLEAVLPTTSAVRHRRFMAVDFIKMSTPQRMARDARAIARFLHPGRPFPP